MSRNNAQEYLRKMEKQRQRFGLRKLSVGVASVLLGTTIIFGGSTVAHADEISQAQNTSNVQTKTTEQNVQDQREQTEAGQNNQDKGVTTQDSTKEAETVEVKTNLQKDSSNQGSKEQNKPEVKTNTLSLTKTDAKSAFNKDALKASKAVAKTNSEKPKDSQKAQDEIHATLNFVDSRNTDTVIKSVTLTGKPGQTVYDALGGNDVYSYILKDYPSYMLLPGAEYKSKVIYTTQPQDKPGLTKYFNDPQLITDYENWHKEYQDGKHPLFDYLPDDPDVTNQSLLSGETPLSDKSTYTVEVVKQIKIRNPKGHVYRLEDYVKAGRNINYNKYLGKDKTEKLAYQVKNGIVWTALGDTVDAPMPVYEALNTHGRIPAHLSKVEYDGNGLPIKSGTYGKGQVTFTIDYPKETAENRKAAEQSGDLTEWSTLDDLVDEIPYTGEYGEDYKTTIGGNSDINSSYVTHNGDIPGNPPDQNIMYYANRKFNVVFKDITYGDGDKAIELTNYDYTDPNQMTMAANSKKNPHNGADNGNYQAYKVDANVYHGKLDDLRNAGYAIVSTDVDLNGQTYSVDEFNKDNLYNEDGTIKPKTYVVKVLRGVKEFTPQATAKREVNYKANSKDGETLKDPITQEVSLTGEGTYYTDATINDSATLVNTKEITDLDGNKVRVVDSENTAPVEVTWQIDTTKSHHDVTKNGDKFDFEKPAGDEAPETIGAWSHVASLDINNAVDQYSPVNKDNKTLEPVYLIYKQKATAHTLHKTITRTIHYVTDGSNHEVLQDPVTQTANLSSTYFTDQDGKEVATTEIDGVHYIDPDKSAPARTWSVDSTGNTEVTGGSFDEKAQDVITVENGKNKGTWSIEYAANDTADSEHLNDKFAPEKAVDTNLPDKSHFDVYLVYTKDVNADITYWDITDGMEHKVQLGKTDNDNDDHGKTGSEIHFNNNEKRISDLENQHYIYVDTDFNKGDKYGTEDSHFNVYFRHAVKEITPNTPIDEIPKDKNGNPIVDPKSLHKEFTRNIYFKANTEDGATLKDSIPQKVEFNGSIYVDLVDNTTTTPETVKDVNGNDVQVATKQSGAIKWDADSKTMGEVKQDTITLNKGDKHATSDDMVGTWYQVSGKADKVNLTPTSDNPQDETLVYKQKAQYNIHYIDVNGVEDKDAYAPTDGHELTDHKVSNVGEGDNIYVGDTPDATKDLWSPEDYEKAGYVLVGMSDNAKDDKLGKQTLTHGVQDQYVYLKHAVTKITPNTPTDEIPKNPDGTPAVNPGDLHKEFTRNITFVANNADKSTLSDKVSQKVGFNGSIYVDLVTGQTTTPETITVKGNQVEVATTEKGKLVWEEVVLGNGSTKTGDKSAELNEVKKPYITLEKGNKYATNDDMVGTWHLISGVADAVALTPDSVNPQDIELVYEKNHSDTGIPGVEPEKPTVDVTEETQTFTRTIVYRGTKDGGKNYEDVNGSPDSKSSYVQTLKFNRKVLSTKDKDGKVTILGTTEWMPVVSNEMPEVPSKKPSEVGYDMVDIDAVSKKDINPDDYPYTDGKPIDLGKTVVTYRSNFVNKQSVSRNIYYRDAETGKTINEELGINAAPAVKQTVDYVRVSLYNKFGIFLGFAKLAMNSNGTAELVDGNPVVEKDANGDPIVATTDPDKGWVASGTHNEYPEQGSPDLTQYGYKRVRALESRDEDKNDGGKSVDSKASDPTKNGDDVNVYYFHDQSEVVSDKPEFGIAEKDLQKTFTRTIIYRGTKDGGKTYQDVDGSPISTHEYKQNVAFTRKAVIDKVTKKVLSYTAWASEKPTMDEVPSKKPNEVGYDEVDKPTVEGRSIDPNSDKTDLGATIVTYTSVAQPTEQPTAQPTEQPTSQPTEQPTSQPTAQPTSQPTVQPTEQPTSQPTAQPTE
ncbi:mucin-binding protein, partial [Limosilactobacillus walteri]